MPRISESPGTAGRSMRGGATIGPLAYTRSLMDAGLVPPHDWRHVMTWDAGDFWPGRRLDSYGTYGVDTHCHIGECAVHYWYVDGVFWATTVMDIYTALGKDVTDRLALYSQQYLSPPLSMLDAAEAMMKADEALYDGRYAFDLAEVFVSRGLIDPNRTDLVLAHDPPVIEDPDTVTELTLGVTGSDIADAKLWYSVDGAAMQLKSLNSNGAGYWRTDIARRTGLGGAQLLLRSAGRIRPHQFPSIYGACNNILACADLRSTCSVCRPSKPAVYFR